MKKLDKKKEEKTIKNIKKAHVRDQMKEAGFFDGRFKSKVIPDKRKKAPKYKEKFN